MNLDQALAEARFLNSREVCAMCGKTHRKYIPDADAMRTTQHQVVPSRRPQPKKEAKQ